MIKMQGKDIAKKGAVSVITAQSAILLELLVLFTRLANLGVQGLLRLLEYYRLGPKKGPWWIPSDQYALRYGANEDANITPQLTEIRVAILAGTYNVNNSAPKCTIQAAHQQITQAISPCRKSKCKCKGGACKAGRCENVDCWLQGIQPCKCKGNNHQ